MSEKRSKNRRSPVSKLERDLRNILSEVLTMPPGQQEILKTKCDQCLCGIIMDALEHDEHEALLRMVQVGTHNPEGAASAVRLYVDNVQRTVEKIRALPVDIVPEHVALAFLTSVRATALLFDGDETRKALVEACVDSVRRFEELISRKEVPSGMTPEEVERRIIELAYSGAAFEVRVLIPHQVMSTGEVQCTYRELNAALESLARQGRLVRNPMLPLAYHAPVKTTSHRLMIPVDEDLLAEIRPVKSDGHHGQSSPVIYH